MRLRILVVEHAKEVTSVLKYVLEGCGNNVVFADDAAAAERVLDDTAEFDLVISDTRFRREPHRLECIQAANATRTPAILEITAFPLLGRDWRSALASATLSRPITMSVLVNTPHDASALVQ